MVTEPPLLLALDLAGTFVLGLNGALTATTRGEERGPR